MGRGKCQVAEKSAIKCLSEVTNGFVRDEGIVISTLTNKWGNRKAVITHFAGEYIVQRYTYEKGQWWQHPHTYSSFTCDRDRIEELFAEAQSWADKEG